MKFPWANILLLIFLLAQVVTGYWGMITNRESFRWILWLHGVGAYAIVVLFYWKSNIILDAFRRKKRWTWQRVAFAVTTFLLLLTMALGLLWTFVGKLYFLNISYVSWHIYVAVPVIMLMLWHSWQMRFVFKMPASLHRRQFLRTATFSLAGLVAWQTANITKRVLALPGAKRRFTGSYERGSFMPTFPVVSWINDNPPPIDIANWQLLVKGAVENPLTLSYDDLRNMALESMEATLDCTGGWYAEQVWRGVALGVVLENAGISLNAKSITIHSITGYQRRFTLAEANRYLLALDVAGTSLSHGHGFPLRLVAHDKRGVEWVKWIAEIEVNTTAKIWQSPLPLQ